MLWAGEPGTGPESWDEMPGEPLHCQPACPSCGVHVCIGEAAKTNDSSAAAGALALEGTRNKSLSHPKRSYCLGLSLRRGGGRQERVNRAAPTSDLGSSHH